MITTPISTPGPTVEAAKFRNAYKSTPMNKERCRPKRRKNSFNRTMNATNLNNLFDSSYINQNTSLDHRRDYGSPKSNGSTQTIISDPPECESETVISETPKTSQLSFLDDLMADIKSSTSLNKQQSQPSFKSKVHYLDANVNINPYAHNPEIKFTNKSKDPSLSEISFFTPHLYNTKTASTPINMARTVPSNYLKSSPIVESSKNVNNNNNNNSVKIDNKISNLIYASTSNTSITEKEKELINHFSPKIRRKDNLSRVSKTRVSKGRPSYRTFSLSDVQKKQNSVDIVFNGLKRISQTSLRWPSKIIDLCAYMGLALKTSFSSIYKLDHTRKNVEPQIIAQPSVSEYHNTNCNYADYKMQLNACQQQLELHKDELDEIKNELKMQKERVHSNEVLHEEIDHLKGEMSQFRDLKLEFADIKCNADYKMQLNACQQQLELLKDELDEIKNEQKMQKERVHSNEVLHEEIDHLKGEMLQFRDLKLEFADIKCNVNNTAPPPPIVSRPRISLDEILNVKLKKTAVSRSSKGDRPAPTRRMTQPIVSRPRISLDEILNVKLKKTAVSKSSKGDRPAPTRRMTQPIVSADILKQVKLKSPSRPQTPLNVHEVISIYESLFKVNQ